MTHVPHWLRERPALKTRAEQIVDELEMDRTMPPPVIHERCSKPKIRSPREEQRGLTLSH